MFPIVQIHLETIREHNMSQQSNLLSIPELQNELRVGRSTVYRVLQSGKIRPIKVGRRTLVHREDVEAYIDSLRKGGDA